MAGLTRAPLVLVSMGTDHHPFPRLSHWVEAWLLSTPHRVRCLVQEGASPVPAGAAGLGLLARAEWQDLVAASTVVVCQGGPGSIMDARHAGFVPLAVPRRVREGEHVDDHQVSFVRQAARLGWVRPVESEGQLNTELERALAAPSSVRCTPDASAAGATAGRLEQELTQLAGGFPSFYAHRIPGATRGVLTTLRGIRV